MSGIPRGQSNISLVRAKNSQNARYSEASSETVEQAFDRVITQHIKDVVKSQNYDSLANCGVYAQILDSPFKPKALALILWADSVWKYVIQEQEKVRTGLRGYIPPEQFIYELPIFGE